MADSAHWARSRRYSQRRRRERGEEAVSRQDGRTVVCAPSKPTQGVLHHHLIPSAARDLPEVPGTSIVGPSLAALARDEVLFPPSPLPILPASRLSRYSCSLYRTGVMQRT